MEGDISPERLRFCKFNEVTEGGEEEERHVTPVQLQWWVELWDQFLRKELGSSMEDLKSRRASSSVMEIATEASKRVTRR